MSSPSQSPRSTSLHFPEPVSPSLRPAPLRLPVRKTGCGITLNNNIDIEGQETHKYSSSSFYSNPSSAPNSPLLFDNSSYRPRRNQVASSKLSYLVSKFKGCDAKDSGKLVGPQRSPSLCRKQGTHDLRPSESIRGDCQLEGARRPYTPDNMDGTMEVASEGSQHVTGLGIAQSASPVGAQTNCDNSFDPNSGPAGVRPDFDRPAKGDGSMPSFSERLGLQKPGAVHQAGSAASQIAKRPG